MKLIKADYPYCDKAYDMLVGFNASVIFSIFENITGELWVDDEKNPEIALGIYKDFCFLSGKPRKVENLDNVLFSKCNKPVLIANTNEWLDFLPENTQFSKTSRFKLKAPESFDTKALEKVCQKIEDFPELEMRIMNGEDYLSYNPDGWEHNMRGCYKNKEDFCEKSFGIIIHDKKEIICGCTAYSYYSGGVEVQIETKKEYRGKGLASIAAAKYMLLCQQRGKKAHWDAAHIQSAKMAMKLGFEMVGEYITYELEKR